jgi:hypothetical protein
MMHLKTSFCLVIFALLIPYAGAAQKNRFPIVANAASVSIVYDRKGPKLDSISATLLAQDIERATSYKPTLVTDITTAKDNIIVIGAVQSALVQQVLGKQSALYNNLDGKWECFSLTVVDKPLAGISKALVIAGSDARGTAYGVFSISEKIGVSPWYWWADVPAKQRPELIIQQDDFVSSTPSVKYRGIFLNDEDWGLQPWAAKTFEPETNDIGPKTYAKIFELLLRLKANLIWPAMHPSTKAFFSYPGNITTAADYQVVVGSSHAEPMLRNNVGEWNEKTMGHFNYLTNKDTIYKYWQNRVKESVGINAIYTIGMRGVHDGGMEGVKDPKDAVPLLERIFKDQRQMLTDMTHKDANKIPQVFTAYKEVLDIYDNGLQLPDDVTLVWPDDNYGYIQRLSNEKEQKRAGGAGVYYHASYWGRPHDYLWLSSTHPALIQEEMMKAYENGADRVWVLNVGDIKPAEYEMQLFLDMAYDAKPFRKSGYAMDHLRAWGEKIFEKESRVWPGNTWWIYYNLAFERRPEFMGWSQTEPTTKTTYTSYNHFQYGDEADKRIKEYEMLERHVKLQLGGCKDIYKDAFYQLVYYPVMCASWMNKKFLYRDKAFLYAKQNRFSAYYYARQSLAAYDSIVKETIFFNDKLARGKWKGMMSMRPRELPVYLAPDLPKLSIQNKKTWDLAPEGYDTIAYRNNLDKRLPVFTGPLRQSYFIDIFLGDSVSVDWAAEPSAAWIRLSSQSGKLTPTGDQSMARLWVDIDWAKAPEKGDAAGFIVFSANGQTEKVTVNVSRPASKDFARYKGFVEENGIVSMYAFHFKKQSAGPANSWKILHGLGAIGPSMQSIVNSDKRPDTTNIKNSSAWLSYEFYSFSQEIPTITIYTLPAHPLNTNYAMRYAISIDDLPLTIVNFKTTGRTEEWKQNVLRNAAIRKISTDRLTPGRHTLKVYAIDPGVALDRIEIKFGSLPANYSAIPETVKN